MLEELRSLITTENTSALATIVGLIANFKAERQSGTIPEFVTWLRDQNRQDLAGAIAASDELGQQVRALLQINHAELVASLRSISERLDTLVANTAAFAGLAHVLDPARHQLSEQALSILQQLLPDGSYLLEHSAMSRAGAAAYLRVGGGTGSLSVPSPRYLQEDLDDLASAGLLQKGFNSKGSRTYAMTRTGEMVARGLKKTEG